jgi:hypothetical protein
MVYCMEEPYIFVTALRLAMSQLARIRTDLASRSSRDAHVATESYRCDTVEELDRLLSDIRARRIDEVRITDSRLGARRLVINYFGA